jgi:hypothetical protein
MHHLMILCICSIGDCNKDSDCGKDLYCYQRFGGYELVPGCAGQGSNQYDYCFDPRNIPGYEGNAGGGGGGGGPNNGKPN